VHYAVTLCVYVRVCVYMYDICDYTSMYVLRCDTILTHTHTYTHTHTHTHTHTQAQAELRERTLQISILEGKISELQGVCAWHKIER
jgi:carbohydrate-binding DOMON domain-containing protein